MDGIGKRQVGNFVSSSGNTQGNTSSTTTNASEEIATARKYIPRQGLGKRRIVTNQTRDESGSTSRMSGVVCSNESSGASSSTALRPSQSKTTCLEHKQSSEVVSVTEASNSEQRDFLSEIRSVVVCENWEAFNEIISTLININNLDEPLTYTVRSRLTELLRGGVKLSSNTAIKQWIILFIKEKREDIVKIFLSISSSSLSIEFGKYTLGSLSFACIHGYIDVVNVLLKNKHHPNGNDSIETQTPIICAIKGRHFDCAKALLVNGANANYGNEGRHAFNPLCLAAYIGEAHLVKLLCDYRSNAIKSEGLSWREDPLACAAYVGSVACIYCLLSHGFKVDGNAQVSRTPLECAAQKGNIKCMSLLLYNGAKVNGVSEVTAPLLSVIFYGDLGIDKKNHINIDVVRLLLRWGANPNIKDFIHGQALPKAVHKNDARCVDLLLQYGAFVDPSIASSLLELALANKNPEIAMSLLLKGAKLDASNGENYNQQLEAKGYENTPPLCLQALCLRRLHTFTYRENALEEAAVLTSIGLPELLKKLFGADKKSAFFQCKSKY